ncbi:hypothetical protein [Streptomyces alanosinicus]|nr:hypothetical protein [Streptomyces alanosinicus]
MIDTGDIDVYLGLDVSDGDGDGDTTAHHSTALPPAGKKTRRTPVTHCSASARSVTPARRGTPLDAVRFRPDGRTYAAAERSGTRLLPRLRATAAGHMCTGTPPGSIRVGHLSFTSSPPMCKEVLRRVGSPGVAFVTCFARGAEVRGGVRSWDVRKDRWTPRTDLSSGSLTPCASCAGPPAGRRTGPWRGPPGSP